MSLFVGTFKVVTPFVKQLGFSLNQQTSSISLLSVYLREKEMSVHMKSFSQMVTGLCYNPKPKTPFYEQMENNSVLNSTQRIVVRKKESILMHEMPWIRLRLIMISKKQDIKGCML